jgi:hypothetical protein
MILYGAILVLMLALISLEVALVFKCSCRNKIKICDIEVNAQVIDFYERWDSDYEITYFPIVRYRVGDMEYSVKSQWGRKNIDKYLANSKVSIRFNSKNPSKFYLVDDKNIILNSYKIFTKLGFMFYLVGVLLILVNLLLHL